MTDSVAGAPLGCMIRAMPPSGERSVPRIGCRTRTFTLRWLRSQSVQRPFSISEAVPSITTGTIGT